MGSGTRSSRSSWGSVGCSRASSRWRVRRASNLIAVLHAYGDTRETLRPQGERMAREIDACLRMPERARVVGRGHAWTDWESDDPREVGRERRRVARLTRSRRVFLFGFSQGGMLALEVAFASEARVLGVVTVGAYLATGGLARPKARIRR